MVTKSQVFANPLKYASIHLCTLRNNFSVHEAKEVSLSALKASRLLEKQKLFSPQRHKMRQNISTSDKYAV